MRVDCALRSETEGSDAADERSAAGTALQADALYDEYLNRVFRTLLRLGVHESAVEDAVHEVFLVLHRRLPEFENRAAIGTYIYAITLRVAQCHRRLYYKHQGDELPEELAHTAPDPEACLEQKQARMFLQHLLDSLKEEQREVFVLSELEELAAPDIATILGIPVNTVYSRLRLARHHFDRILARTRAASSRRPS
jgi:RNA polymerase sigma-70 factor (ECF subfamily)